MSRTILTEVEGWSPVIDSIVAELGPITAVVFGVVWRYCQMEKGTCTASQEIIASRSGIARQNVIRHLKRLVAAGYLSETIIKGIGAIYSDTGKAGLTQTIKAGNVSRKMTRPVTKDDTGVSRIITPTCHDSLHKESLLRDSLRDKEESNATPAARPIDGYLSDNDACEIYRQSASTVHVPFDKMSEIIAAIRAIHASRNGDTVEYLRGFYEAAKVKYGKNVKLFWLTEWAANGEVPSKDRVKTNGSVPYREPTAEDYAGTKNFLLED
jgi:hypothetical protein